MFDNNTYSVLYGLYRYLSPILTLWYVYLFFFRLYPRLAKASLMAQTHRINPDAVGSISDTDVAVYAIVSQLVVSSFVKHFSNKTKS